MRPVFRFAPSPNGELHLGHAYSALLNDDLARAMNGRLLLRIEDIDLTRTRERFVHQIFEDLAWLGVTWEQPVRRQSEHFDDYGRAAARLRAAGWLYPCFCSRREIESAARLAGIGRDPDGVPLYPGTCRSMSSERLDDRLARCEPHVLRLDMAAALRAVRGQALVYLAFDADGHEREVDAAPMRWGDAVIVRKDTPTSYHLSVVVDDALQGVSHVVRGADLEAATDLHRLLQALLALPVPRYHHHKLITDAGGRKLAKSLRDLGIAQLRRNGVTPQQIRDMVGLAEPYMPTPRTST